MRISGRRITEIVLSLILIFIVCARSKATQCAILAGVNRQMCEAAQRAIRSIPKAQLASGQPHAALTTGLSDAIKGDVLGPVLSPKEFKSLFTLARAGDGSFILEPGFYEAYVDSFNVDAPSGNVAGIGAFFPAPYLGQRAAILTTAFKQVEFHPELSHAAIQELVTMIYAGTDIEQMPPRVQQIAVVLLPRKVAQQLQASARAKSTDRDVMEQLNRRDGGGRPTAQDSTAQANASEGDSDTQSTLPVARGSWAQMPGGFYVRYFPDYVLHTRIQIMVSDTALAKANGPLTFDPTQYVAILAQSPLQRIGISLRPAKR